MLSPDVRIVDIDGAHWANLLALGRRPGGRRGGWLLVFVDGKRVVRAIHTRDGAVDPAAVAWRGPGTPLEPIRRAHDAGRIVVVDEGGLAALFERAESLLGPGQDYVEQLLNVMRAVRLKNGDGLWIEPRTLSRFPIPSYAAVQHTFDRLWPDGRTLVFYVVDEANDGVHCSLILGKQRGDIELVTTHMAIAGEAHIGKDWRHRGYKDVLAAVRERFGPAHLGVFLDVAGLERIGRGPRGALAREIARRHVVVEPAPAWLLTVIGGTAAYGVAESAAGFIARFLPRDWQARVRAMTPFAPLGFNPIELLQTWRARKGKNGPS